METGSDIAVVLGAIAPAEATDAEMDPGLREAQRLLDAESSVLTASWKVDIPSMRVQWSPENHTIYGTDPETFVPTLESINDAYHPGDRERIAQTAGRWIEDGRPFSVLARVVRTTGEVRVVEFRGWVETDEDGNPIALQGTTTDLTRVVTSRRDREALGEQRDMILRAAGDAICGLDRDGRVTFSNPALLNLLGRDEPRVVGMRLHDLVHRDPLGAEYHPLAQCAFTRRGGEPSRRTDTAFHRSDGTRLQVSYVEVSVENDRFDGTVLSLRDVTDSRETARRLSDSLEQNKNLSAQRGALLRDLVAAEENERSRIAADLHDDTAQTLSAVALRLAGAAAAARDEDAAAALVDAEYHVRAATMRMRFLLFELLPPVTETDLRVAVEAYCELLFPSAGIAYEVSGEAQNVPIDVFMLAYRLIQEILRNVLKHSEASCTQVDLVCEGEELTVRVRDDGVGFDPDATGTAMSAGLRIVRQRAQAAGGSAEMETGDSCQGTLITLRLPLGSGVVRRRGTVHRDPLRLADREQAA